MSSRRTMVLIAAVVMGALAAFVLRGYVNDQEAKANPNPVEVYMITRDINRGEPFTSASAAIKKQTMPAKYRPATFVTDLKSLDGKVAATKLAANQVLVENMFVTTSVEATGLRQRLSNDYVAIAVPIEGVRAVGGLLQPGDDVNILVTPKPTDASAASSSTEGAAGATPKPAGASAVDPKLTPYSSAARYLYQQVRILSIGSSVVPDATEAVKPTASSATLATTGGSIVFEVPSDAAQIIASIDPTSFYLVLVKENWTPKELPALGADAIKSGAALPGEDPTKLTPYGPKGFPSATASGATAAPTTTKAN